MVPLFARDYSNKSVAQNDGQPVINERNSPQTKKNISETEIRVAIQKARDEYGPNSKQVLHSLKQLARYLRKDSSRREDLINVLERIISIVRNLRNENHLELADVLSAYGTVLFEQRYYSRAEPVLLESLAIFDKHGNTKSSRKISILVKLAKLYQLTGYPAHAVPFIERGLVLDARKRGKQLDIVVDLIKLGNIYYRKAETASALPIFQRALKIAQNKYGDRHKYIELALNNVGSAHIALEQYNDALDIFKRNLIISKVLHGKISMDAALAMAGVARANQGLGHHALAIQFYKKSLSIRESIKGVRDKNLLPTLDRLVISLLSLNRYSEAIAVYKKIVAIQEKVLGKDHPDLAISLNSLANVYRNMSRYADSLPLYQRSLAIRENHYGMKHLSVASSLNNLAGSYSALARYDLALPLYERSLTIKEELLGTKNESIALSLNNLAILYSRIGKPKYALKLANRSLGIREELLHGKEDLDLTNSLDTVARMYINLGQFKQASVVAERSLRIRKKLLANDHLEVADAMSTLASVYSEDSHYTKALILHRKVLEIRQKRLGEMHMDVARSLMSIAYVLRLLGEYKSAMKFYERSLKITKNLLGDKHPEVATILSNMAVLHKIAGEYEEALKLNEHSLEIRKRIGNTLLLTGSLNNMAGIYIEIGEYSKALPLLNQCISILESKYGSEYKHVATCNDGLAITYEKLGQVSRAVKLYERSLRIREKVYGLGHPLVANTLDNLALAHAEMKDYKIALRLLNRSIEIRKKNYPADHPDLAISYNNLAFLYNQVKQRAQALSLYEKSLSIKLIVYGAIHPYVAITLSNIGSVKVGMKDYQSALDYFQRAMVILDSSAGAAPERLWRTQNNLRFAYAKLGYQKLAILWGKEAVNTIQGMRTGLKGLDKDLQKGFLQKRRHVYQNLADLLIQQGRLQEAQVVLQMLKEDELHNTLKRSSSIDPRTTQIELNGLEHKSFAQYYRLREQQVDLAREREELLRKQKLAEITPAEVKRLAEINVKLLPPLRQAMQVFLRALQKNLTRYANEKAYRKRDTSLKLVQTNLQKALRSAYAANPDANVVAVQYVVTDERLSILLSTSDAPPLARQLPLDALNLRKRVLSIRERLSNPRSDRKLLLQELQQLYKLLIEPVAADLKTYGADTLVLVPNDVLRYVPFAALHDGRRYLVQNYTLTLFNEAVRKDFRTKESGGWKLVAMGLTRPVEDLPALPSVREEVTAITTRAGLVGTAYLDDQFTLPVLYNSLKQNYNVLHLASHFVFVPGRPDASRIFLGDRSPLTLGDIARANLRFDPFSLVTFSACESGLGGGLSADGRDMESLGALVQTQGAKAVIATLWKVEDSSTATFMENFYRSHEEEQLGKAQALRQAQLRFIKRGEESVLAHPYYWAPFILMGDWR